MAGAPRSFLLVAAAVRRLTTAFLAIACTIFAATLVLLSVDVTLRYGFNSSLPGLHEGVAIAFVYVFLLGAAALYARNEDIVLEFVYSRFPAKARRWFLLAIYVAVAVTMAIVLAQTAVLIESQKRIMTSALRVPLSIQWIPLAIAAASITFTSLVEIWACSIWIVSGTRPSVWPDRGGDQGLRPMEGDKR